MSEELYQRLKALPLEEQQRLFDSLSREQQRAVLALKEQATAAPAAPARRGFDPMAAFRGDIRGEFDALVQGAAEGATFGYSHELDAGINSLFSDKTYEQLMREREAGAAQLKEAHPNYYTGGEIAGAIGTAAIPVAGQLGTAARGVSTAGRLGRGIASGTAAGALDATGRAKGGFMERVKEIPKGALIGGVTGGVGGAGAMALTSFASKVMGTSVGGAVERELLRLAGDANMSPDDIVRRIEANDPEIMAEMTDSLKAATRRYFQRGGQSANTIGPAVWKRAADKTAKAQTAVEGALRQGAQDTPDNLMQAWKRGDEAIKADLGSRYTNAYASAPDITPQMARQFEESLAGSPGLVSSIEDALAATPGAQPLLDRTTGRLLPGRVPRLEELERARSALREQVDAAYDAKNYTLARGLEQREEMLRTAIDEFSPSLRSTRAAYALQSAESRAFDTGRKILTKPSQEAKGLAEEAIGIGQREPVEAASQAARNRALREGAASSMRDVFDPRTINPDALPAAGAMNRIYGSTLMDLMGDGAESEAAVQAVRGMTRARDTAGTITRGSQTGANIFEDQSALGGQAADILAHPTAANMVSGAVRWINKNMGAQLSPDQMRMVAETLVSEDPDFVRRALAGQIDQSTVRDTVQRALAAAPRGATVGVLDMMEGE